MDISNAQRNGFGYIVATINGVETYVPEDEGNTEYTALIESGVDIAPYVPPVMTVEQTRATAAAYRADFCNGLAELGILSDSEAISAAKGDWPPAMNFVLTGLGLTPAQSRAAQIDWASCVKVERNHWAVLMMVWADVVTEEQADELCGVPTS